MRRLVLSLLAASSLALLTACGQGGTAFSSGSNGNANRVVFTGTQGLSGVFFVRAGSGIQVTAEAVYGSQNVLSSDQNFTFSWAFAPAGTLYQNGSVSGAQQSACAAPPSGAAPPLNTILSNAGPNYVTVTPFPTAAGYAAAETGAAPYCINLVATHTVDGVQGSVVIDVTT
ncbi:MAG: hypothetical protein WCE44_08590 [Candidatus Velthaea sp.]|jgi:hypothetical protein